MSRLNWHGESIVCQHINCTTNNRYKVHGLWVYVDGKQYWIYLCNRHAAHQKRKASLKEEAFHNHSWVTGSKSYGENEE